MKHPYFLFPLLGFLIFTCSCQYKPDDFPTVFKSTYEVAIPITDKAIDDLIFSAFPDEMTDDVLMTTGSQYISKLSFPAYISDILGQGYKIEWLEPKAIINAKFSDKVKMDLTFLLVDNTSQPYVYTIASDLILKQGENRYFGNESSRIKPTTLDHFKSDSELYIALTITILDDIVVKDIKKAEIWAKLGLKARINVIENL